MIKRHTTFYINKFTPVEFCGKTIFWEVETNGVFELPFEIEPTKGEHDYNACTNCKNVLDELEERLKKKFEGNNEKQGFPFCCLQHNKLLEFNEFNRGYFTNVPNITARKIIYTIQHITNNYSLENWYKKITDYINWAIESFGKMPNNCGEPLYLSDYFFYVADILKGDKNIPTEDKNRILDYLETYKKPNETSKTDIKILLETYEKWLKVFPFAISYFSNLKQQFETQLPLLDGKTEVNIYSGMVRVKMHTKTSLIEVLINTTKELLDKINVRELIDNGIISDLNKHSFELETETLKVTTDQITKDFSKGELKYVKALKKWLQLHKDYFGRIALLKIPPVNKTTDTVDTESPVSQTKRIITDALNALDRKEGWRYAFANKEDFTTFLNLLTSFFEYKPYTIPQVIIKLKKSSKTRFAQALRPIHKSLSENSLKSDSDFFKILKVLNHFQNLTDDEIYSSITK